MKTKISDNIPKTIGIIGGGQLGRMICFYAHMLGLRTVVFSDEIDSPASFVSNQTIVSSYEDKDALKKFCDLIDLASFEFENIPLNCARYVEKHVPLFPKSEILEITQNRILEKNFLRKIEIKTTDFLEISNLEDLQAGLRIFKKAVLKTATMGYDGKGQFVLSSESDLAKIWLQTCNQTLILEKFCSFDSEISTIVARSKYGEIICYEPLTNIHKNGILDRSIYPAQISQNLKYNSQKIAVKIAQELDLVGVMAVEFFVYGEELLVNELAPRPHNSGHFSMNAAHTSQFEQLVRAIFGLKLGNCEFHSHGEMKNLIGFEVEKIEEYLDNPLAKIHLYGKKEVKQGRKMGHVNLILKTF